MRGKAPFLPKRPLTCLAPAEAKAKAHLTTRDPTDTTAGRRQLPLEFGSLAAWNFCPFDLIRRILSIICAWKFHTVLGNVVVIL